MNFNMDLAPVLKFKRHLEGPRDTGAKFYSRRARSSISSASTTSNRSSSVGYRTVNSKPASPGAPKSGNKLVAKGGKSNIKKNINNKYDHSKRSSYFVDGSSHIVDSSVRKVGVHNKNPLGYLELEPDDIKLLKPMVYGAKYDFKRDPCPFYAPWNPPKLRREEDEEHRQGHSHNHEIHHHADSQTTFSLIEKFKSAIDKPQQMAKPCSMFDCSNICFTFDKIPNSDDIGSVPLKDFDSLKNADKSKSGAASLANSKSTKKKVSLQIKPLKIETLYNKPYKRSKFPDSPAKTIPFFVLRGKPILSAPLSFLGNTYMGPKKLLALSADNPTYKKVGIHRYEVNMEGFRDEQITFEIYEKRISVTGRHPPSPSVKNPAGSKPVKREVVEMFNLAPFLNMNRMRIFRTKVGQIIFEEKWKDDESSEEESNPTRPRIKKRNKSEFF